MSNYYTQKVGSENIVYYKQGKGEPTLFLHGVFYRPRNYHQLFDQLANQYELIIPKLIGVNQLKNPPQSIKEYTELTNDFCQALDFEPQHLLGHSTGGAVGFYYTSKNSFVLDVVGMNPVLPAEHIPEQLMLKGAKIVVRELLGLVGDNYQRLTSRFKVTREFFPYFWNAIKSPNANWKLLEDIAQFKYDSFKVEQPALLLQGEEDEIFDLDDKIEAEIRIAFTDLVIKRYPFGNHEWCVFEPKEAAQQIKEFHKRNKKNYN